MHVTVREVNIPSEAEKERKCFVRVDWKGQDLGSGFDLLLTDGEHAWRGEVTEGALRCEAEELEMQKDTYVQDLHHALSGTESSVTYNFTLSPPASSSSPILTLAYEKVQKEISFRLGAVLLRPVAEPVEAVRDLLAHGLQRARKVEQQNCKLEEENLRLRQEQEHITAQLERYANGKEVLEAELYSRFVLVLNEKKAKIRSLQQALTQLQEARRSENQDKAGPSHRPAEIAEDEYGCSTEEEQEDEEEEEQAAGSATITLPSQESDSPCLLDDGVNDIADVAPCRKRRFRHLAKPDSVAQRDVPSPRTSSRKKLDSPVAERSTDTTSPTAEDLFEDF